MFIVEPITVELAVVNPLKVALMLRDLTLLWRFVPPASSDPVMRHFTDKLDSDSRPLSYSNDNEFCLVSCGRLLSLCSSFHMQGFFSLILEMRGATLKLPLSISRCLNH